MKNLRNSSEPFFNPTPSGDEPIEDRADGGGEKEMAPDPIGETTSEIVTLAEKYAAGAIDAVAYADQILPLIALREDRMKHHHPSNRDVVKKIFEAASVRYSTILRDFDYGEIVEKFYPLSRLNEHAKKTRALVRDVADVRFAHRPFLDVITSFDQTATRPTERLQLTGRSFHYNQEHTNRCANLMLDILALPEAQSVGDGKKRKGLAILVILESLAKAKMIQDIDDLLKKPGSVVSRGEEEFWEHHLLGNLKDEGVVFCRNYVEQIRDHILTIAKDEYGDSGGRVIDAWGSLSSAAVSTPEARRYVIEKLMSGKIQNAERVFKKSSEKRPTMQPDTSKKKEPSERQKGTQAELSREKALKLLKEYDRHLLLSIESLKQTRSFHRSINFMYVSLGNPFFLHESGREAFPEYDVLAVRLYPLQRKYMIHPFFNRPTPERLMKRISLGSDVRQALSKGQSWEDVTNLTTRFGGTSALVDIGPLNNLSHDSIHEAVMNFFDTHEVFHGLLKESVSGEDATEGEKRSLEKLLSLYHHVFIKPVRKTKRSDPEVELSLIHILGVLSVDDAKKRDKLDRCLSAIGELQNPALLFRRITLSPRGILQNQISSITAFSQMLASVEEARDMGLHESLSGILAIQLGNEYKKNIDGE